MEAETGQTQPDDDEKKKRPGILPADTMAEAAVKTLRFHLARMLEHEAGTRLGEDSEELHVMRVSSRRMRMALRVFDEYLDRQAMRPVLKGLRRTGRTLGAVRDLDDRAGLDAAGRLMADADHLDRAVIFYFGDKAADLARPDIQNGDDVIPAAFGGEDPRQHTLS